MKNKRKTIIVIALVVFIGLFTFAYMTDSLRFLGLCKPGYKFYIAPFAGPSCYKPSGFEGQPCDKSTDCGTGGCRLVNPNVTTGKGVCTDLRFGCNVWIDEEGNFDPKEVLCVD